MDEKKLDCSEVCTIIEVCAKSGVAKLKFGDLSVEFANSQTVNSRHLSNNPEAEISETQHEANTKEAVTQGEHDFRDEQVAHALIENPMLAEELIRDGELEDADDEPGDDEQ